MSLYELSNINNTDNIDAQEPLRAGDNDEEPSQAGDNDAQEPVQLSAVEIQQQYYEAVGDVDWELYEKQDRHLLLQKLAVALCGSPKGEGNLTYTSDEITLQGYPLLRDKEAVMTVFKKICEQAKYSHNGENILISVLRVLCVMPTKEVGMFERTPADYWWNLHDKRGKENVTILVFHVFAIRKCIPKNTRGKGCTIFIDHEGRVYKNWTDYLNKNKLPKCVMVVPQNGKYEGQLQLVPDAVGSDGEINQMPRVKLTVVPSPALGIEARILDVADKTSVGLGVGSILGVAGAAVVAPVALPAAVGTATVIGIGTGIYSIVRSGIHLADRKKHEQTIGLGDSESRASWINILVSAVGMSLTVAGKLLTWAAATGTSVEILMNAVSFLKYSNNVTSAAGVLNAMGDMAYKYAKYDETPTSSDYFNVTVSALFFGIGVMSNQTAQDIVQDAQAEKINSVRDSLSSNNKRKVFDKVTAETRRLNGNINGNAEVIRALEKIENKDDFFAKLGRVNKQVKTNKIRISLTADAETLINNKYSTDLSKLYKLGINGRNKLFTKLGPAKVDSKNAPTRVYQSKKTLVFGHSSSNNASGINNDDILKITAFLVQLSKTDKEFVCKILSNISKKIHDEFLLLCAEILSSLMPEELLFLKTLWPNFEIHLVLFVYNYFKKLIPEIKESDNAFIVLIKSFIHDGKINEETIRNFKVMFLEKANEVKNSYYDDPSKYDDFQNFRSGSAQFMSLSAGDVVELGKHKVLVKWTTIKMFESQFDKYDQVQCDLITMIIFDIVSRLSHEDADRVLLTNPDEDLIMRVSTCVLEITKIDELVQLLSMTETDLKKEVTLLLRDLVVLWSNEKELRKQTICKMCKGILYI